MSRKELPTLTGSHSVFRVTRGWELDAMGLVGTLTHWGTGSGTRSKERLASSCKEGLEWEGTRRALET